MQHGYEEIGDTIERLEGEKAELLEALERVRTQRLGAGLPNYEWVDEAIRKATGPDAGQGRF